MTVALKTVAVAMQTMVMATTTMPAEQTALQVELTVQEPEEHRRESVGVPSSAVVLLEADLCPNLRRCGESITTRGSAWRSSVGMHMLLMRP